MFSIILDFLAYIIYLDRITRGILILI